MKLFFLLCSFVTLLIGSTADDSATCPLAPAEDIPILLSTPADSGSPTSMYASEFRVAVLFRNSNTVVDSNGLARTVGTWGLHVAVDVHSHDYVLRSTMPDQLVVLEDIDTGESWDLSIADDGKFFRYNDDVVVASPRFFDLLAAPQFKFAVIKSGVPEIRTATLDMSGNNLANLQGVMWEGNAIWALVRVKDSSNEGYVQAFNLDDTSAKMRQYNCPATLYDSAAGEGELYALEAGNSMVAISTTMDDDDFYFFTGKFDHTIEPMKNAAACGKYFYAIGSDGQIQSITREERIPVDFYRDSTYSSSITGIAISGGLLYISKEDSEIHLINPTGGSVEPKSTTHPTYSWGGCESLNSMEIELHHLVNEYRVENGLPAVNLSSSLTETAWYHMKNQLDEPPVGAQCNMHSWMSPCPEHAPCDMCCYSGTESTCIISKPSTITNGKFPYHGHENSFASIGADFPSAAYILDNWKNSPGHNALILNLDSWENKVWVSMGVGLNTDDGEYYHFANLWFSDYEDPQGYCNVSGEDPESTGYESGDEYTGESTGYESGDEYTGDVSGEYTDDAFTSTSATDGAARSVFGGIIVSIVLLLTI